MGQSQDLIALLVLDDGEARPGANRVRYAETPLLLRQIDMAIALGCDAVWLMARDPADIDALAAQHLAESNDLTFRLLTRPSQLAVSIPDDAEVLVLAPGVLARDMETLRTLGAGPGIVTLPADHETAAGLERLDLQSAWGGLLRMPALLVRQLEALGDDCEPLSALLRLARSSCVEERPLPLEWLKEAKWQLSANGGSAVLSGTRSKGLSLGVLHSAADFFAKRNLPGVLPVVVAGVLVVMSAIALWAVKPATAILLLVVAMMAGALGKTVRRLANPQTISGSGARNWQDALTPIPEILAATGLGLGLSLTDSLIAAIFAATVTLILTWIGRELAGPGLQPFLAAPLLWSVIAIIGLLGAWWAAAILASGVSLIAIVFHVRGARRITGF